MAKRSRKSSRKNSSYKSRSTGRRRSSKRNTRRPAKRGRATAQTVRIVVEQVPASAGAENAPAFDDNGRMVQNRARKVARF